MLFNVWLLLVVEKVFLCSWVLFAMWQLASAAFCDRMQSDWWDTIWLWSVFSAVFFFVCLEVALREITFITVLGPEVSGNSGLSFCRLCFVPFLMMGLTLAVLLKGCECLKVVEQPGNDSNVLLLLPRMHLFSITGIKLSQETAAKKPSGGLGFSMTSIAMSSIALRKHVFIDLLLLLIYSQKSSIPPFISFHCQDVNVSDHGYAFMYVLRFSSGSMTKYFQV